MNAKETEDTLRRLRELCPPFEDYSWVEALDALKTFHCTSGPGLPYLRVAFFEPWHGSTTRVRASIYLGYASEESTLVQTLAIARRLGDMAALIRRVFDPLDTEEKD